jgi:hypothetical protein
MVQRIPDPLQSEPPSGLPLPIYLKNFEKELEHVRLITDLYKNQVKISHHQSAGNFSQRSLLIHLSVPIDQNKIRALPRTFGTLDTIKETTEFLTSQNPTRENRN